MILVWSRRPRPLRPVSAAVRPAPSRAGRTDLVPASPLLKILLPDLLDGHLPPGPQAEGRRPLVEQHIHPVEGLQSRLSGHPQQLCLPGLVDHVRHGQPGVEPGGGGDQAAGIRSIPTGVVFTRRSACPRQVRSASRSSRSWRTTRHWEARSSSAATRSAGARRRPWG